MSKPPASEQVQVNFRMPVGLRDRIKAAAEDSHRSMNAEIIARLEDTFAPPIDLPPDQIQLDTDELVRMDRIMRDFAELIANRKSRGLSEPVRIQDQGGRSENED